MTNYVITIARGFGSGGKTVGQMLSQNLGINYYDRDLLKLASEDSGINEGLFGQADEKIRGAKFKKSRYMGDVLPPDSDDFVSDDNLFNFQAKTIRRLAEKESCIIVGRCADFVLSDKPNIIRVFVHASKQTCIQNVIDRYSIDPREAEKMIDKIDKSRSAYYKYYTGREWDNARNYDLCLDSSRLGFDKCVQIIENYLKVRMG